MHDIAHIIADLTEIDGQPMTDSLKVAARFGKDHSKVLRSIREIRRTQPEFHAANFGELIDHVEVGNGANVAPRITPADIAANITCEHYFTAGDGIVGAAGGPGPHTYNSTLDILTFCVLTLRNGCTVTGESACASPENFNAEIGRRIARENAVAKALPLMGYELRSKLAAG